MDGFTLSDFELINRRAEELTPTARGALATYLLLSVDEMSTDSIMNSMGYKSRRGAQYLMDNLSFAGVPIYQPREGYWAINKGDM